MKQLFVISFLSILSNGLLAQCSPPAADICQEAIVICGLSALDGYTCRNPNYSNPSGPTPLCPSGGAPHNLGWWAFTTGGGDITINVTFSNCLNNQGVQIGIYEDCTFAAAIACDPNCHNSGSITIVAALIPCHTYYLFVDGCNGDVCDFTLNTSKSNDPDIGSIGYINRDSTQIDTICRGTCDYVASIDEFLNNCQHYYKWTYDGVPIGDATNKAEIAEFNMDGTFEICVFAIMGNPNDTGPICSISDTSCMKIVVISGLKDAIGEKKLLCIEQNAFQWHNQFIYYPGGEYRQPFDIPGSPCCKYDSVVNFEFILEIPPTDIFHIGQNRSDYFVHANGNSYTVCESGSNIFIPRLVQPALCDSNLILHQFLFDARVTWTINCKNDKLVIKPLIDWSRSCYDRLYNPQVSFDNHWTVTEGNQTYIVSNDEELIVEKNAIHCLESVVSVRYGFATRKFLYKFTCEPYLESNYIPQIITLNRPVRTDTVCVGSIEKYLILNSNPSLIKVHSHSVEGGLILPPSPNSLDTLNVEWNTVGTGKVCVNHDGFCGNGVTMCKDIAIVNPPTNLAGPDQKLKGISTRMQAHASYPGMWKIVSGPSSARVFPLNAPIAKLLVNKVGKYTLRWESMAYNCNQTDDVIVEFTATQKEPDDKGPERDSFTLKRLDERLYFQDMCKQELESIKKGNTISYKSLHVYNLQGQLISYTADNLDAGLYIVQMETEWCRHVYKKYVDQ